VGRGSDVTQVRASVVSHDFLHVLGIRPASGRLFDTGPGTLVWFALLGGAGYALYLTWRQYRSGAAY